MAPIDDYKDVKISTDIHPHSLAGCAQVLARDMSQVAVRVCGVKFSKCVGPFEYEMAAERARARIVDVIGGSARSPEDARRIAYVAIGLVGDPMLVDALVGAILVGYTDEAIMAGGAAQA